MEPLMASNKHPWLILSLFFFAIFSSIPSSFSQSNPQNIQVFFPFEPIPTIPPPTPIQPISPPPSPPLPPLSPPPSLPLSPPPSLPLSPPTTSTPNTTSRRSVGTAVGVTAASTIVLSALFFLLLMRHRKRKRERKERGVSVNPYSNPYGQNRVNPGLSRDQFVRFDGNVKGVIVDEEGLDVLYWRKLNENGNGVAKTNFNKEILKNTARDVREEEKKMVESASVSDRRRRLSESPVQEIPLLRGKSSNSEAWPQKEDGKSHIHNLMAEGKPELKSQLPLPPAMSSVAVSRPAPPPPPVSVAAIAVSRPAPPPPVSVAAIAVPPVSVAAIAVSRPAPPPPVSVAAIAVSRPPPPPPPISVAAVAVSRPPPPPPPMTVMSAAKPAPPPPPPPRGGGVASSSKPPPPPPMGNNSKKVNSTSEEVSMAEGGNGQVKLKPLHWDKVNPNVEHSMVWHKMEKGSFKFDGDLMEALFGTVAAKKSPRGNPNSTSPKGDNKSGPPSKIFILDTRKSQNIAIVLKSLAISRREIIDSLVEGQGLSTDTLEKLARIAPTKEEESAILEFEGDSTRLADAESFLFHILKAVPTAFSRFNAMLFKSNYGSEISHLKDSLQTLESACKELRNRGLFVKLLEAILKAGNRMNAGTSRGNAQAFNLSSLLKLSDVKSSDGKTTLLHFVVEEVVRSEGKRCMLNRNRSLNRSGSRGDGQSESQLSKDQREKDYIMLGLPVVGGVSSEFSNVKKAASIDYDAFSKSFSALTTCLAEIKVIVEQCNGDVVGQGRGFVREMEKFLDASEGEIKGVKEEEKRVMDIVKNTNEYYQAKATSKDKGGNFKLFIIVKEFLGMVDKTCVEIAVNLQKRRPDRGVREREPTPSSSSPRSPARPSVKFPVLPPNFMSDSSKSSSSDSDED